MLKPQLKYYLYDEVCIHNKRDDFWVVIHGNVFDLTQLLNDRLDSWNNVNILISSQSYLKTKNGNFSCLIC